MMAYVKVLKTFKASHKASPKASASSKAAKVQPRSAFVDGPKAPAYPAPNQSIKIIAAPQPLRQQKDLSIAASTRKSFRILPKTNNTKPPIASLFYAFQTFQVANHARNRAHLNQEQYRTYLEALGIMQEAFEDAGIARHFDFEDHLPKVMRKSAADKIVRKSAAGETTRKKKRKVK